MKKALLILLVLSFGFNLYLLDYEQVAVDDFEEDSMPIKRSQILDEVKVAQSSLKSSMKSSPKSATSFDCSCPKAIEKIQKVSESDKNIELDVQRKLNESKTKWLADSEKFFIDEIRLSDSQIMRYHELALNRQKEIDNYFLPKMEKVNEENERSGSDKGFYLHTTEDSIFMGEVALKYDSFLKENFSENAFKDYKEFVRNYNQKLMTSGFYYPIEF